MEKPNIEQLQKESRIRHRKAYTQKPIFRMALSRFVEERIDRNIRGEILYGKEVFYADLIATERQKEREAVK